MRILRCIESEPVKGAPCLVVSSGWSEAHQVAPEKDDVGVSCHCSVFIARPLDSAPHLLRSLRAQCIYLEPVLSLNTLLRGPVDRLAGMADNALPKSPTSLIPRLVLTSSVNTRRSTLLYDERMSTLRMIFKFAVPIRMFCIDRQLAANDVLQVLCQP